MFHICKAMASNPLLLSLLPDNSNPQIDWQNALKIAVNVTSQLIRKAVTDREVMIRPARLVTPCISPNYSLQKTRSTVAMMMRDTKNLLISILRHRATLACHLQRAYSSSIICSMERLCNSTTLILFEKLETSQNNCK